MSSIVKRRIARAFTALYLFQTLLAAIPAAAQITPSPGAPSGQKPLIDAAANGVPLILIAPPSAAGVSVNKFQNFNVAPSGIIFNNATGNAQTQLGGWIRPNLQLGATPARIILNEITGPNQSLLQGPLEIGGHKADIVVANPNGITCNGCTFLNTNRATLATGTPLLGPGGALTGFDIRTGVLNIGTGGLSATAQQQLDLYARGLILEGELWTQNLQALIGANQITQGPLGAQSQATPTTPGPTPGPNTPRFAVDIKALGGMYAGSIYLIATEKGLGVNSIGRVSTLASNLVLSANGQLTLKDSYSAQDASLTATGAVTLTGQNQAEANLTVQGQGVTTAAATLSAPRITIDAGAGALNNQAGTIQATANTPDALRINATGIQNPAGTLQANGAIALNARAAELNNTAGLISGSALTIANAATLNNASGTIYSQSSLGITTGAFNNRQGAIAAQGSLTLSTSNPSSSQPFNNAGGLLQSQTALTLDTGTGDLNNTGGTIVAGTDLTVHAATVDTRPGPGPTSTVTPGVTPGLIAAGNTLNLTATQLQAGGAALASGATITLAVTGQTDLTAAHIDAGGPLTLNTGTLQANASTIAANSDIAITSSAITSSDISTASSSTSLANSTWSAQGSLSLTSAGPLDATAATLRAGNDATLQATGLTTANADIAARNLSLDARLGQLNNTAGQLQATGHLSATGQGINNQSGTIAANGQVTLDATTGELNNTAGRLYSAQSQTSVTAAQTANTDGLIAAATDLSLQGGPLHNTRGVLSGARSVDINLQGLTNDAGVIEAGTGGLSLNTQTGALRNTASGIVSAGSLAITAAALYNTASTPGGAGYIGAGTTLSIATAGDLLNPAGALITSAATTLSAGGDIANAGLINSTDGQTRLTATSVHNTGRIYGDSVTITAATTNSATTNSASPAGPAGPAGPSASAGAVIASRTGDITINGSLTNTGASLILSQRDLTITGPVANDGSTLSAERNLTIAGSLANTNSALALTTVTTRDTSGAGLGTFIRPLGTTTTYTPSQLLYTPRDSGFWVLPSTLYPLARFGGDAKPLMSDCINSGDGNTSCGNLYSLSDPIWALMGIATPGPGPGNPPAGCAIDNGDASVQRVTAGACGAYWSGLDAWQASIPPASAQLDAAIAAFNQDVLSRNVNNWFELTVTARTLERTAIAATQPGQILAGGNITLAAGLNQDSLIVAGGNLSGGLLNNLATQGTTITTQQGTQRYSWGDHDGGLLGSGYRRNYGPIQPIADAPTVTTFDLPTVTYLAATPPASVVTPAAIPAPPATADPSAIDPSALTQPPLPASTIAAIQRARQQGTTPPPGSSAPAGITSAALQTAQAANTRARRQTPLLVKADGYLTVTSQGLIRVPGSQLFSLNRAPAARFLVETDPAFTGYRQWLSSDYFLTQLALDPERSFKRYGDGFAEQRLVDDQILALTGRRYLSGYSATETEYQDLLDAGVQYARQFQLTPGVTLSPAQMASLTSDIVWLEAKPVTLPDGTTVQALVPTVYLRRPLQGDLTPTGALIAGANVTLRSAGDLANSGTLYANGDAANGDGRLTLDAQNIANTGTIAGNAITISASQTLNNQGGVIQGLGPASVAALNARDIILRTTTQTTARQIQGPNGLSTGTATNADRIATLTAGSLILAAQNNIDIKGAVVQATADLTATAGGNINTDALQTGYTLSTPQGGSNSGRSGYLKQDVITQQLTSLQAGGNINLSATGNAAFKGTNADAGNHLTVQAANITLDAATAKQAIDQQGVKPTGYDRFAQSDETTVGGVFTAGNNATFIANGNQAQGQGNITVTGASLGAKEGQASLIASNNVTLQNAQTQHTQATESHASSKSLLSKSSTTQTSTSQSTQAEASNILGNTVLLQAGTDATVQASQINAVRDIQINAGRDIAITAAEQSSSATSSFEQKSSGLVASRSQISWGKSAQNETQAIQSTTQAGSTVSGANVSLSAGRDAAVTASTVLADRDIAVSAGRNIALNAAANTQATQSQAHSSSTLIGLQPTLPTGRFTAYGTSSSNQNADTTNTSQSTSLLSANNGNLTIVAGTDAQYRGTARGNLTAQGADLLAKGTITATGNAVDLQAAQDTSNSRSHQDSKSLTLGSQLTGAIGGAITSIGDMVEQAGDTQNARLQGALALKAGYDAYKLSSGAQATVEAGKATQPVDPNGGFGISLSIASSKSSQDNQQSATTSRGTNLQAKAIDIQARDTDITATGAKLQAQDITLDAAGRINLNAAKNTAALQSTNKGSSSGLGVTLGSTGTGQNGLSFQASASQTKGNASGSDTTYDNTLITASNQLTIKSGGDTNLKGAQLAANTIKADIGGNLNIESLQDQSDYASKQTSSGFSVSLCIPPLCEGAPVTGSVSSAKQTIDHNYQSATGQSGIAAGQGGYDVTVKGNTDLKGGAITSQADKNANTLKTNSLTYTDLENRQTTNSSSSSTSLGYGGVGGMGGMLANNVTANVLGNLQGNASLPKDNQQSSKTQSVISPGHVTITGNDEQSKQAVATLTSRDLKTANGALKNTLTLQQAQDLAAKQKEQQENQRAAELMGAVMTNVIGDVAAKAGWADGSAQKLALHGIAGLVQAKVGGGNALAGIAGGMTQEALAPVLADYLFSHGYDANEAGISPEQRATRQADYKALMQAGMTLAGAAVGAIAGNGQGAATGASVALTGVTNNYLTHPQSQAKQARLATASSETEKKAIEKEYAALDAKQRDDAAACLLYSKCTSVFSKDDLRLR